MFLKNPIRIEFDKEEIVPSLKKEGKHRLQRAQRGYSDADLWNFDSFLANLICNGINGLSQYIGTPWAEYKGHELTHDEWLSILGEIKEGFCYYEYHKEALWDITDPEERKNYEKEISKKFKRSCKLLGKWFGALWW